MDRTERMIKILKEEFGIETVRQLNEAMSSLQTIDISIFIKKPDRKQEVM